MAINSIDLADKEATPVTHTFTLIQSGPKAMWVNAVGSTIISSQETLTLEIGRPQTDAAQQTARVVILDPVEGTVDGRQVVLRQLSGATVFKFPPGSSRQEKLNQVELQRNALGNPDIVAAIVDGIPVT